MLERAWLVSAACWFILPPSVVEPCGWIRHELGLPCRRLALDCSDDHIDRCLLERLVQSLFGASFRFAIWVGTPEPFGGNFEIASIFFFLGFFLSILSKKERRYTLRCPVDMTIDFIDIFMSRGPSTGHVHGTGFMSTGHAPFLLLAPFAFASSGIGLKPRRYLTNDVGSRSAFALQLPQSRDIEHESLLGRRRDAGGKPWSRARQRGSTAVRPGVTVIDRF